MDKKSTFNSIITDYEYARPTYPKELFADIIEYSCLQNHSKVLEIGAGTGQATKYFAERNYDLTALEIGNEQVEFLRKKFPATKIICNQFEDYDCKKKSIDLILSATAFHWIPAEIGYPKAYQLLKSGGTMVAFWHMYSVTKFEDKIHSGIYEICSKYAPETSRKYDKNELQMINEKRINEVQTGNHFSIPEYREYRWNDTYDSKKYIALLNTYSDFQILDKECRVNVLEKIQNFIEANGGTVVVPQTVRLYMVRKA